MRRGAMALAAAALLGVGCSTADGGSEPATASDGGTARQEDGAMATKEADVWTVAYPTDWEVVSDDSAQFVAGGPTGDSGIRPSVTVKVDDGFTGDFDTVVDGLTNTAALAGQPDRENVADEAADVAGSRTARLVEATWTAEEGGEQVPMRQYDLFAVAPDGDLVYLTYNAPADDFDEDLGRAVVDSLEVR